MRKYVLNPLLVLAFYTLFLTTMLPYGEPFRNFMNPGFWLLFPFFLNIRFLDDFSDWYGDRLKDKAVLGRRMLMICAICCTVCIAFGSVFSGRYLFLLLACGVWGICLFSLGAFKPLIVPCVFGALLFHEFSFKPLPVVFVALSFAMSLIFALLRKNRKETWPLEEIGGKAYNLQQLNIKGTPAWYPVKDSLLTPPDREKLELIVNMFCRKGRLYAVRSSAIDEDSGTNSFAGVHDTFLNVPKEEVLEKILLVAESAHSETALKYRRENGLSVEDIRIAVLIQEMVAADYAGVLNTINPVTNNISETVISVTEGLGDKLVDGTVDGSMYYVDSRKKDVKGPDILPPKVLKKLLKLADELRAKTDRFQDCEFAVKGNRVYFLQSRAITTYDVDTHGMTMLIDNSNLIESYYGITSPLTHSFAHEVYSKVYTATCRLGKVSGKNMRLLKPSLDNMLYSYEGKLYYNLNSWYNVTSMVPSKNSTKYMENMMGVKTGRKDFKQAKLTLFELVRTGLVILNKFRNIDRLSDVFVENFNRIVSPYYGRNLDHLSVNELKKLYEEISDSVIPEFTTPILNDIGVMMNFGRLKEKVKKYPDSDELLALAVNNNGNVESAKNATEFVKLLDYIKARPELLKDFEDLPEVDLSKKYLLNEVGKNEENFNGSNGDERNDVNGLSKMIGEYIWRFGPRVMNELKLETVTMIEEPSMIFALIREGLKNTSAPVEMSEDVEIPARLRKLAAKARHFIRNRERLRLRRTYVFSVIRNIFLSCGRNLEKEGKLDSYRDVFYLKKDEIFHPAPDFNYRRIVTERKAQEEIDSKQPYYSRIAFFGDVALPVSFISQEGLTGLPSGSGVVTAKVCVMENKDSQFIPGSIIVTARTDPGWISLFPLASGLIVEHGSMLSHSFVVAREMHLPCVVGVQGITGILKTGDVVTLDSLKGEVIKITSL